MNNWTGVPRYEKIGDYVIYYRDEEEQTVITQIERGIGGIGLYIIHTLLSLTTIIWKP